MDKALAYFLVLSAFAVVVLLVRKKTKSKSDYSGPPLPEKDREGQIP